MTQTLDPTKEGTETFPGKGSGNFEGEGGSSTKWRGKAGRRVGVKGEVRRERNGYL